MSRIDGLGNGLPIRSVGAPSKTVYRDISGASVPQQPVTDKLELSGVGHLLGVLKQNDIRADKVAAVRAQIDAGTYEDDNKLNVAVDRLLEDILR